MPFGSTPLNLMYAAALKHLATVDPVMKQLIGEHGPCTLSPETRRPPFQSLVQAVAHQQLHATAAGNILARFKKMFPGRAFPRPEDLAGVTDEQIRACGFSFAKIRAIRDMADKTLSGVVPTSRRIAHLPDEDIIARLTEGRGVGRWTVEMLLIFQLGRPDVLPADDFGVRNGFRLAYKKRSPAQAQRPAQVRRTLASARHHRRLVSLACRRRRAKIGVEKEVTQAGISGK